jgi:hypothetical protein
VIIMNLQCLRNGSRTNSSQQEQFGVAVSVSKALLAQALGVAFDRAYYFDTRRRRETDARCHEYVDEHLSDLDAFYTESNLGRKTYFHSGQILIGGIQPNLILGMLLGAEFIPAACGDADISPNCWAGMPAADLPAEAALLAHPLIRQLDEQIQTVEREGELTAIPPFFWDGSGRAAVHGALTTAQKFLGEQVFVDLLTEPDRVRQVMEWITDANIALVRHYAGLCGIALAGVHVGECSSCMLGPVEWEEFVAPTLQRVRRELGPVRLHSCGASNHILPAARRLHGVYSLDLGGETSLAKVRELFGRDFEVNIAPPVKLLMGGSVAALMEWTMKVLAENQAGKLLILYHLEPQYPLDTLREWHDKLEPLRTSSTKSV